MKKDLLYLFFSGCCGDFPLSDGQNSNDDSVQHCRSSAFGLKCPTRHSGENTELGVGGWGAGQTWGCGPRCAFTLRAASPAALCSLTLLVPKWNS